MIDTQERLWNHIDRLEELAVRDRNAFCATFALGVASFAAAIAIAPQSASLIFGLAFATYVVVASLAIPCFAIAAGYQSVSSFYRGRQYRRRAEVLAIAVEGDQSITSIYDRFNRDPDLRSFAWLGELEEVISWLASNDYITVLPSRKVVLPYVAC